MIVKKIDIENYKGFEQQEISFNDNLNVFIGANASGKTSVLEAIVKCLYDVTKDFVQISNRKLSLNRKDINYNSDYCSIVSYLQDGDNVVPINLMTSLRASNDPIIITKKTDWNNNAKHRNSFVEEISWKINHETLTLPIIKYFLADKIQVKYTKKPSIDTYQTAQLETWTNIIQTPYSYTKFLHWFFDYENEELRMKMEKQDLSVEHPHLRYVRYAIEKTLRKTHQKDYIIKSKQIQRQGNHELIPTLFIQLKNDNSAPQIDLESLSDGEKAIITLVGDIAYNLALAHDSASDASYLDAPGIVLIDEIEEHLHPNWQRKIIPILTSVFPKIQFFITTHSPQVISSVNSEHVFLCQDFTVGKVYLKTKGVDSNALLTFLFNSTERPKEYMDLINEFDELLDNDADIAELEGIIEKVIELENEDTGNNISGLVSDLELQLEAYKFELEHEMD